MVLSLVGICFLLHLVIPHHHHADAQSVVEHRHIIEHARGMHNEAEEHKHHHHHHENLLDEPTYDVQDHHRYYDVLKLFLHPWALMPVASASVPSPVVRYLSVDILMSGEVPALSDTYLHCRALRAPPVIV